MKDWPGWVHLAFGVILGLAAGAVILIIARQPSGSPVTLAQRATPSTILVHVSGAVVNPGVYELAPGERAQDALRKAGGALPDANLNALNLAAGLADGQHIVVLAIGQTPPAADPSAPGQPSSGALVDLNSATQEQLIGLPGIGEDRADAIIRYREQHNGFDSIEEIMNVEGIGPATFEGLKDQVTVTPLP